MRIYRTVYVLLTAALPVYPGLTAKARTVVVRLTVMVTLLPGLTLADPVVGVLPLVV
jgi:hypothetical protein